MSDECDPSQTTQFEVTKTGVKISSKRMSELVAILSMVMLGVQSAFTWQLYREVGAQTIALRAEFAELKLKLEAATASSRYVACLVANQGGDMTRAERGCKFSSGAQQ